MPHFLTHLGTYCRGGPPCPPVVCTRVQELNSVGFGEHDSKPRAATEGRPYSTFRGFFSLNK
jgi:hypothetical protein